MRSPADRSRKTLMPPRTSPKVKGLKGEIEVFTQNAGARRLFSKGRWIRVRVVLIGTKLTITAVRQADQYNKTLQLSPITACSIANLHGRTNCIVLTGFNRNAGTKRVFDCISVEARNQWQAAFVTASTKANKMSSGAITNQPQAQKPMRHASYVRRKKKTLESFMLWHEEWRRTPEFKASSKARRRWWAAMYLVALDVFRKREERYGYSSLELIKLQKKLTDIDTHTISEIKRKARRIIRRFVQESKKNSSKFGEVVLDGARKRGLGVEREPSNCSGRHTKAYLDSGFRKQLQTLLRKEKVLPKLTRTLELIRRKERHQFVLLDAMRGLWVARCVRALLNLPGGLAAVLAMPQERGSLRRLLAAALLCRVPILTTLVIEMLAGLLLLSTHEGKAVVHNVLAQIDRFAKWGQPLCSDYLLRPSAEALKWSPVSPRSPPPFVALATLLNDTPEHNCSPELRSAVVTLFAALCRSEATRSAAQWTQAKIFHACRAALTPPKMAWRQRDAPLESEAMERARRRRSFIGHERGADDDYGDMYDEDELHPCPPLLTLLEFERKQGSYDSEEVNYAEEEEDANQLFRIQLENFLDGWFKRELDEADEIDALAIGTAERIDLLAERIRRSMLLLGRYTNVDEALHAFTLDVEHGALMPIAKLAHHTIVNDDGDENARHISLNMDATLNAICRLHLNTSVSGHGVESLVAMARQSNGSTLDGRRGGFEAPREMRLSKSMSSFSDSPRGRRPQRRQVGPALKDDPRFISYFRMIKLHVPRIAIEAKMVQEGLDPALLDHPNEPAPDATFDDSTIDDTGSIASDVTTLENDATYGKFFKMLRLHVPRGAIEQKMEAQGLDPSLLDHPMEPAPRAAKDAMHILSNDIEDDSSTAMLRENDDITEENDFLESIPLGCQRAPRQKLRKVFWDVVIDPTGTVWEDILASPAFSSTEEADEYPLNETALEELELVFGLASRKTDVSKADRSAEAAAQQMRKFERAMSQAAAFGGTSAEDGTHPSIVATALGEKRAFALNLLYGSLRISNDECVAAIAGLDPTNNEFVEKLPRLGTLYNIISRKEDLVMIEHALVDAGVFDDTTKNVVPGTDLTQYDGLSRLMIGLLDRARRPRAKVQALWLYATVKDRAAELFTAMKNYEKVTDAITTSGAFRQVLSVVLCITNFVNYGSDRGGNAGVRISALNKLHMTRTTTTDIGNIRNLLQFVVRHSGVASSQLKHEIPIELLRNVHTGSARETIHSGIDQLRAERDDAVAERGVLSREATTQAPGADARRVAVAAAAAARMAHIVADVDDELAGLDAAFTKMDNTVDAMLRFFGEPNAASCDVADWLRSLEVFLTHYDAEYTEYREQMARREKRNTLARKQREREQLFQNEEVGSPKEHLPPTSPLANNGRTNVATGNPGRISQRFDRLIDDVARGLVENSDQKEKTEVHICDQCKNCDSSTTPGAFTNDGSKNWYCVDCWYDFSFANPTNWRDDFGEETTPVVNSE